MKYVKVLPISRGVRPLYSMPVMVSAKVLDSYDYVPYLNVNGMIYTFAIVNSDMVYIVAIDGNDEYHSLNRKEINGFRMLLDCKYYY